MVVCYFKISLDYFTWFLFIALEVLFGLIWLRCCLIFWFLIFGFWFCLLVKLGFVLYVWICFVFDLIFSLLFLIVDCLIVFPYLLFVVYWFDFCFMDLVCLIWVELFWLVVLCFWLVLTLWSLGLFFIVGFDLGGCISYALVSGWCVCFCC